MIHLENILKRSLQDVLKTFWKRLQNVLKMSWRHFSKLKKSWQDVLKTSWKKSWKRLEDVWPRRIFGLHQDVLKTSWKRLLKTYELSKYFRPDQDVFKTSSSRRMFAGLALFSILILPYFRVKGFKKNPFKKTSIYLTHLRLTFLLYTPWKHQKTWDFWCFQGV